MSRWEGNFALDQGGQGGMHAQLAALRRLMQVRARGGRQTRARAMRRHADARLHGWLAGWLAGASCRMHASLMLPCCPAALPPGACPALPCPACQVLDPQLHAAFEAAGCLDYFFAFRWLLVCFKREFKFEEVTGCSSSCKLGSA